MPTPQEIHMHVHIEGLPDWGALLTRIEEAMATAAEQLDTLIARSAAQGAAITDLRNDVLAMRAIFEAERENFSAAGQSKMDALVAEQDARDAQIADLDLEVGDADGSDSDPEPAPEG